MSLCLPHPLLVADIGGTNCRVGVVDRPGDEPRVIERVTTSSAATPERAIGRVLRGTGVAPRSAAIAVAGPVVGSSAVFTNANWRIEGADFAKALGLETGILVNDFEALALALPRLRGEELHQIGEALGLPEPIGARLVLGPGTGFGAAALAGKPGRLMVVPSEAGHIELGPSAPDEARFWPHMERYHGRFAVEGVLSGAGLARIDSAMRLAEGRYARHGDGAAVHMAAQAGDAVSRAAVRMFGRLLARVAGDLALAVKATGGVFIAGGVAPKLLPLFDESEMRAAFAAKAPMVELMNGIPLFVVTGADPAERGLAALACDPAAYGLEDRLWA